MIAVIALPLPKPKLALREETRAVRMGYFGILSEESKLDISQSQKNSLLSVAILAEL